MSHNSPRRGRSTFTTHYSPVSSNGVSLLDEDFRRVPAGVSHPGPDVSLRENAFSCRVTSHRIVLAYLFPVPISPEPHCVPGGALASGLAAWQVLPDGQPVLHLLWVCTLRAAPDPVGGRVVRVEVALQGERGVGRVQQHELVRCCRGAGNEHQSRAGKRLLKSLNVSLRSNAHFAVTSVDPGISWVGSWSGTSTKLLPSTSIYRPL